MGGGCTLCLGVHLQLSPVNLVPIFFSALGGARAPSAPPGYAYGQQSHKSKKFQESNGGATAGSARSNDPAGRSTVLAPPCLLLCFCNNVTENKNITISDRFICFILTVKQSAALATTKTEKILATPMPPSALSFCAHNVKSWLRP